MEYTLAETDIQCKDWVIIATIELLFFSDPFIFLLEEVIERR